MRGQDTGTGDGVGERRGTRRGLAYVGERERGSLVRVGVCGGVLGTGDES